MSVKFLDKSELIILFTKIIKNTSNYTYRKYTRKTQPGELQVYLLFTTEFDIKLIILCYKIKT